MILHIFYLNDYFYMNHLIYHLKAYNPKSVTPVTLFKKHYSNTNNLVWGFELTNEHWLIGYGLDAENGLKRNQKYITGIMAED